jgi:hypothetical protein
LVAYSTSNPINCGIRDQLSTMNARYRRGTDVSQMLRRYPSQEVPKNPDRRQTGKRRRSP